jgi:hypothetical protein
MKAFLMHRDRDFNPQQPLPPQAQSLIDDLELETLFRAMAQGDDFLYDVARQAVLSSLDDPDEIRYRQDILRDCLKNADVVREIYRIPIEAIQRKHR